MREYDKPIEPTSEETERLMNQEFGYDPDKRGSMVMEAEEYARRQWADSAPEDYVEGSKNDYLQGYHDAVEKACEWLDENAAHYIEVVNGVTLFNGHKMLCDYRKAMEG